MKRRALNATPSLEIWDHSGVVWSSTIDVGDTHIGGMRSLSHELLLIVKLLLGLLRWLLMWRRRRLLPSL
jgi:hypothetical protein